MGQGQLDVLDPVEFIPGRMAPPFFLLRTGVNDDTVAIPFGRMAAIKSGDENDGCVSLASATDKLAGIVGYETDFDRTLNLATLAAESTIANPTPGPIAGQRVTLVEFGLVDVEVEATPKRGDPVFVRYAASGGNIRVGVFSNAGGAGLRDISNVARWFLGAASVSRLFLALGGNSPKQSVFDGAVLTAGAKTSNHIDVTASVLDGNGNVVASEFDGKVWLSDVAGGALTGTNPTSACTVQAGVDIDQSFSTTVQRDFVASTSAGVLTIRVTNTSSPQSWFVNFGIQGRVYSIQITF